jgi:hypothetical protein
LKTALVRAKPTSTLAACKKRFRFIHSGWENEFPAPIQYLGECSLLPARMGGKNLRRLAVAAQRFWRV